MEIPAHRPGEIIISRLNPRIPRVLIVPDLQKPLLCSSEFEVLCPANGYSPYAIACLLVSSVVQEQIHALTAGTSASHSWVKPAKIFQIQMPWPTEETLSEFNNIISTYKNSAQTLFSSGLSIFNLRQQEKERLIF